MEELVYDIEADNLLPGLTTIWCIGVCNPKTPDDVVTYTDYDDNHPSLLEGLLRLKNAKRLIGHNNIGYDCPAIEKLYPGYVRFEQQWDNMTVAALLNPSRRSLALASFGKEFGFEKGDFHDFSAYSEEMRVYMVRDVALTARVYNDLQQKLKQAYVSGIDYRKSIELEHQVQLCLALQSHHGFRFDVKNAELLSAKLSGKVSALEQALTEVFLPIVRPKNARWCYAKRTWKAPEIFKPKVNNVPAGYVKNAEVVRAIVQVFNPGSREQVAIRLSQLYGWTPQEYTEDGRPKVDESVLKELEYPEAKVLVSYYKTNKQLAQLCEGKTAWLKLHENGRMHGYVRSCGARTHRMSHSRPNMAQCDKAKAMRSLWIPDNGHVLVGVDANALELVMLSCYLYPWDKGAYARAVLTGRKEDGNDAHTLNMKAAGLKSRDFSKTYFYALIYGAGNEKLGSVYAQDHAENGNQTFPKSAYRAIGKQSRQSIEDGVTGLGQLIAAVGDKASKKGYIVLPDGRKAESGARTALNTLLQGAGSVLMKKALVIFHHELMVTAGLVHGVDYALVANVHDEQQITAKPEHAKTVGESFSRAITLAGEALGLPVPFSGDYQIGTSWAETH